MNVALPTISKQLHFAPNNLQWVVTAYTLTFGGFLLLRRTRLRFVWASKNIHVFAVSLFALLSLVCGLAQTETQLIFARAAQGLAAAIMSTRSIIDCLYLNSLKAKNAAKLWACGRPSPQVERRSWSIARWHNNAIFRLEMEFLRERTSRYPCLQLLP